MSKSRLIEIDPTTIVKVESQDGAPARLTFYVEDRTYPLNASALAAVLAVLEGTPNGEA